MDEAVGDEHLRAWLENYTRHTVPALEIDAYSEKVYQANQLPVCDQAVHRSPSNFTFYGPVVNHARPVAPNRPHGN
jgi:hypothetical protein